MRKIPIEVGFYPRELEALTARAKDEEVPRSDLVRRVVMNYVTGGNIERTIANETPISLLLKDEEEQI